MSQRIQVAVSAITKTKQGQPTDCASQGGDHHPPHAAGPEGISEEGKLELGPEFQGLGSADIWNLHVPRTGKRLPRGDLSPLNDRRQSHGTTVR